MVKAYHSRSEFLTPGVGGVTSHWYISPKNIKITMIIYCYDYNVCYMQTVFWNKPVSCIDNRSVNWCPHISTKQTEEKTGKGSS